MQSHPAIKYVLVYLYFLLERRILKKGTCVELFQVYLIVGLVLIGAEIFVPGFVLAPLGVASLITAAFASVVDSEIAHIAFFSATALIIFLLLPKLLKFKKIKSEEEQTIGLIGQTGILVEPHRSPLSPGRVRVFGDVWEISWDENDPFHDTLLLLSPGALLIVKQVIGNKIHVEPKS
jgi:membrane protein implicated in regulation of membrane protease activity